MGAPPLFRLFGFPIHVRGGFVLFMVLVVFANGGSLGLWIAGSAAVLTLLHELGHAFAARATGASAEISLDFLAGFASFVPTRPLKRWERAGISISGPAVQIGVSLAVLVLMGVNPLERESFARSPASLAIWWTGPVMGLFNLAPVLPLDGGHIALAAIDRIVPGHAQKAMIWFSIVFTGAAGLYLATNPRLQGFTFFVLFPLMVQVQMLTARSRPTTPGVQPRNAAGEAAAWQLGDVSRLAAGDVPSPWYRAMQQLQQGHPDVARDVLLADFGETGRPNWSPPDAAPAEALASLVALLPRPLPHGRLYSDVVLAYILLRLGDDDAAARYAAETYARTPSTDAALVVARAAGSLGDRDTAVGWLRAAFDAGTNMDGLEAAVESAPELTSVRDDPRFAQLRARLDS
jgi:Zn-dependent protease